MSLVLLTLIIVSYIENLMVIDSRVFFSPWVGVDELHEMLWPTTDKGSIIPQ